MAKRQVGRPKKDIDWDTVDKLCALHCNGVEIAAFIGVSYEHLKKMVRSEFKMTFPDYFTMKSASGKISLRRRQYTAAVDEGNVTMQIWLGKQWLGQTDKQEIDTTVKFNELSDDQLDQKLAALLDKVIK